MIKSGMASVTFRKKTPEEIIEISAKAKLNAIEWGSDIHVPAGDIKTAKDVYEKTIAAGLEVASYGSYYYLGDGEDFQPYIDSAVALHAPNIRVWAGKKASAEATDEDWNRAAADAMKISEKAALENITISLEYHPGSLTDTLKSTLRLLELAPASNLFSYWQQPLEIAPKERLSDLLILLQSGRVSNIHVYHYNEANERHLLKEGVAVWDAYLNAAKDHSRYALLEFVLDENDDNFYEDCKTLNQLKDKANK